MCTETLFTVAKTWKPPKRLLTDEWIKKMWCLYTIEHYSTIKKMKCCHLQHHGWIWRVLCCVMAPHSSTLAWTIPWTEEPGRLQSMGSLSRTQLSDFTFTFHFHALEKEMATHSSVLAWRIPETGEPGGLPSMGSHRVGHD